MHCEQFIRCLTLVVGLLATGTTVASETLDACNAAGWRAQVEAAEKAVVKSVPYKVPAAVWHGSTMQACAVVTFTVDADGRAVSPAVLAFAPNVIAGRAALETLKGFRFSAARDVRLTLRFQLSRFGPEGD